MKRFTVVLLLLAMVAMFAFAEGRQEAPKGKTDVVVLKFSDCHNVTATNHLALKAMAEEIEKQTNGRVKVEIHPSCELGDVNASQESVQMGTLDMAITNQAALGTIVPEFGVIGAPFIFESDEHAYKVLNGAVGDKLKELSAAKHINIAGYLLTGFRHVFSTVPIKTPADFKNVKIRCMENPVDCAIFNNMGALATPMPYGELFMGLQQHTVAAGENAVSNYLTDQFFEVAPYLCLDGHTYNISPIIISDNAIQKIPEDVRGAFFKACKDGLEIGRQMCMEVNQSALADLEAKGVKITYDIDREALKKMTAPVYAQFTDRIPPELVKEVEAAR